MRGLGRAGHDHPAKEARDSLRYPPHTHPATAGFHMIIQWETGKGPLETAVCPSAPTRPEAVVIQVGEAARKLVRQE